MYPKDALPLPDAAHPLRQWPRGSVSAQALALAHAAARDSRPWVVVAPDARTLDQLQRALGFFVDGDAPILHLPDWEVLPYEQFSPLPDLVSDRLATLAQLPRLQKGLLLVSAETLLQRLPPTDYIEGRAFDLAEGQSFSMRAVSEQLVRAGYQMVAQVGAPGEFALRGSLFDVFPMGYAQPLRIDLFDENIDSIRHFDPDTQRSLERLPKLRLLPAREIPLDEDSCREFRRRYRTRFEGDPTRSTVYRGLRQNIGPVGIEFYLPLFFEGTATLFDYLPRDPVLVLPEHLDSRLGQVWQEIAARYEDQRHDIEHPVLEPAELFLSPEEAMVRIGQRARVEWSAESPAAVQGAPEIKLDTRAAQPLEPLVRYLDSYPGRVLLAADSPGRREVLHDLLRGAGLAHDQVGGWRDFLKSKARLCLAIGADVGGLSLQAPDITLLADGELFGRHAQQERRRRRSQLDPAAILRDLQDLSAGAPVVHTEYGVGRYVGLQPMQVAGEDGEFLVIEYAGGDRIYVPVQRAAQRQSIHGRFAGGGAAAQARLGPVGQGAPPRRRTGARRRRRTARSLCAPPGPQGQRAHGRRGRVPRLCRGLPVRGDGRPGRSHHRGAARHGLGAAHGPRGLRRRGLRQDGGGHARRVRGRTGRKTGGGAGAHHAAGRAARRQLPRPLRGPAGAHRIAVAIPLGHGFEGHPRAAGRRPDRHPGRHAPAAACRCALPQPRTHHR
ncbi:MAG: hypothetical protein IPM70_13335 [Proteobacteria bacterium]|nr:hypothetical protein [Pseudomonadota bacterium]